MRELLEKMQKKNSILNMGAILNDISHPSQKQIEIKIECFRVNFCL
jgi:hypothetical protein